jgi:hypothetical protein
MANGLKERFIQLLEDDIAQLRKTAEAWEELEKYGARLEGLDGKTIATAREMVAGRRANEKELRELLEKVRAL